MSGEFQHIPVLLDETLTLLAPERGGTFVDGTLGGGGHAEAVLLRLPKDGRLFGIDLDEEALQASTERLSGFGERFKAIHGNFFSMKALLAEQASFIVIADCGADPEYRFGDLENLVRTARIDLEAEIAFWNSDQRKSSVTPQSIWDQGKTSWRIRSRRA